jgi:hypothetical protein
VGEGIAAGCGLGLLHLAFAFFHQAGQVVFGRAAYLGTCFGGLLGRALLLSGAGLSLGLGLCCDLCFGLCIHLCGVVCFHICFKLGQFAGEFGLCLLTQGRMTPDLRLGGVAGGLVFVVVVVVFLKLTRFDRGFQCGPLDLEHAGARGSGSGGGFWGLKRWRWLGGGFMFFVKNVACGQIIEIIQSRIGL